MRIKLSWCLLSLWLVSLLFYFHAMYLKNETYCSLQNKIEQLEKERDVAFQQQEELLEEIQSREDPSWIEMVLKKRLGVVPQGQMKVYFKQNE